MKTFLSILGAALVLVLFGGCAALTGTPVASLSSVPGYTQFHPMATP